MEVDSRYQVDTREQVCSLRTRLTHTLAVLTPDPQLFFPLADVMRFLEIPYAFTLASELTSAGSKEARRIRSESGLLPSQT